MKFDQRFDWFWHILLMLVMTAVVGGLWLAYSHDLTQALLFGVGFGVGHYHGREKRDCENKFKIPSPHLVSFDFRRWSSDQLSDFFAPAVAGVLILIAWVEYVSFW